MANCPKIRYKDVVPDTIKIGTIEVLDINDDSGNRIYHKHKEGVCLIKNGTTVVDDAGCGGTISYTNGNDGRYFWAKNCSIGGSSHTGGWHYVNSMEEAVSASGTAYGTTRYTNERCGYGYTSHKVDKYTCGLTGTTTESDITDITDSTWFKQ